MVGNFLDAITIALYNNLGDKYTYYVEEVEQGLKIPCFSIQALNPSIRSCGIKRYHRVIPIIVYYFTDKLNTKDATKDNYAVAENLIAALEYLPFDTDYLFRGEGIEWEIVDGALQFSITYSFDTTEEFEIIYMEDGYLNGAAIPKP